MRLLRISVAFAIGIAAEKLLETRPSTTEVLVVAASIFGLVAATYFAPRFRLHSTLIAALMVGVVWTTFFTTDALPADWENLPRNEQRISVEGILRGDPVPSNGGVRLRLDINRSGDKQPSYSVDVYTDRLHDRTNENRRSSDFRYGDIYLASGRFIATPNRESVGFISTPSVTLLRPGDTNSIRARLASIRAGVSETLSRTLDTKTAGLAAALLVGDRTKLHPETIEDFRTSGLSHVLAISGLHIAMLGGIVMAVSVWLLGRQHRIYLIAPAISVWVYAALSGLSPSVTRAAIMFSTYLIARFLGRQKNVLPPLAFAAVVMLAVDPTILGSISFQLSFAAVLGIAILSGRLAGRIGEIIQNSSLLPQFSKRLLIGVAYGSAVSFAATTATAPLVAFHFGQVPVWGLPSTLLIVPVLPVFIVGAALAGAITGTIGEPLAVASLTPHALGNYISYIASSFGDLPPGPVKIAGLSVFLIVSWFAGIFALLNRRSLQAISLTVWSALRTRPVTTFVTPTHVRRPPRTGLIAMTGIWAAVGLSLVGFALTSQAGDDLRVDFFETNRGDMILVETPAGTRLLVDAGDDPDLAVANLESALPPLDRRIDVVLSTHPDADHLGGLERVVEQFQVGTIIDSGVTHSSNIQQSWQLMLDRNKNVVTATPGMVLALDTETTLSVLQTRCIVVTCSDFNDRSVVARLDFRDVSLLLTGDITANAELDLLRTGEHVESTILKVGHHGSQTSSNPDFLEAVDPALAIVTTGIKNQFGHPHTEVIDRLTDRLGESAVYVTRNSGTVSLTTDGSRVWVATDR